MPILLALLTVSFQASTGMAQNADLEQKVKALEAEVQQLRLANQEIQALKEEMAKMRQAKEENWLNQRRAEDIKALIHEVLSDAETRKSLGVGSMHAGYDKHFFLASPGDNFLLEIVGQIQTRYIANSRQEPVGGADENEFGFQMHRVRLTFQGHIISPDLEYRIKGEYSRTDGDMELRDAFFKYKFADGYYVQAGQFKAPFWYEHLVSSAKQLAVERSNLTGFFSLSRPQGVEVGGEYDHWRWALMVHDGREATNVDFAADSTDFAVAGRAEWLLAGQWKQFSDFQAWSGDPLGIKLGAAFDYEVAEGGQDTTLDFTDFWQWTADISLERDPWNAFVAVVARHVNGDADLGEINQMGFLAQAGVFVIPDKMDIYGRWEYLDHDGFSEVAGNPAAIDPALEDQTHVFTVGTNYYFKKHDAKFTLDMLWAPEGIRFGESGTGTLTSTGSDDQIVIRAQMQLLF